MDTTEGPTPRDECGIDYMTHVRCVYKIRAEKSLPSARGSDYSRSMAACRRFPHSIAATMIL